MNRFNDFSHDDLYEATVKSGFIKYRPILNRLPELTLPNIELNNEILYNTLLEVGHLSDCIYTSKRIVKAATAQRYSNEAEKLLGKALTILHLHGELTLKEE